MEQIIESMGLCSGILVPLLACWAVASLYSLKSGTSCNITECAFFLSLLLIAGFTVRTVVADDGCWLIHTTSLGAMIIAGVLRRPGDAVDALV